MTLDRAHVSAWVVALIALFTIPTTGVGQWLKHPTPGIPRTSDGKPDLFAPAPRTLDGKPDLSGLWSAGIGTKFESDFKPEDAHPWAQEQAKRHAANLGTDTWAALCLPPGPMINFTGPLKILQTVGIVAILYEVPNNFRKSLPMAVSFPTIPTQPGKGTP